MITPGPAFTPVTSAMSDRESQDGQTWVTIWSRFPLIPLRPTNDRARAVAAKISPPGARPFIVYGAVLPWLGSSWRHFPAVNGQAFQAALKAQRGDWTALQAENPDCDFVLAGDLNQDLAPKHYYGSRANRSALCDALQQARLVCLTAGEVDPVWKQTNGQHASIDHVCVSGRLVPSRSSSPVVWPQAAQPQLDLSDHFGVVVELAGA